MYDPLRFSKIQCVTSRLGTTDIIKKFDDPVKKYKGAFFVSRTFSKQKLETAIKLPDHKSSSKKKNVP